MKNKYWLILLLVFFSAGSFNVANASYGQNGNGPKLVKKVSKPLPAAKTIRQAAQMLNSSRPNLSKSLMDHIRNPVPSELRLAADSLRGSDAELSDRLRKIANQMAS